MIKVTSPVYWHHDLLTWWTEKGISLSKTQEDPPRAFLMPFSKTELKSNAKETQILAADKAQECQYRRQSFSANVSAKMPAYTFFLEKEMATHSSTFAW